MCRRYIIFLIFALVLMAFGCAGDKDPLIPAHAGPQGLTQSNDLGRTENRQAAHKDHFPILTYRLYLDVQKQTIEIVPDRGVLTHYDVTGLLTSPSCSNCLILKVLNWDMAQRRMTLEATLKNPTQKDAYDVRLILDSAKDGYSLLDPTTNMADGYTQLWDYWGETRNPFSAFAKLDTLRKFPAGATRKQSVVLVYPPNFAIQDDILCTVDASWPGNCKEPYEICNFNLDNTVIPDHNSIVGIRCRVHSWPGNAINKVTALIEPKGDIGALYSVDLTNTSGDFYQGTLCLSGDVYPGHYRVWLKASSATDPDNVMWQMADEVDVTHVPGPWDSQWARTWGGASSDHGCSVTHDSSGDIYVGGDFSGPVDFDPSKNVWSRKPNNGICDAFICKYGPDGSFKWAITWGCLNANNAVHLYDIAIDNDRNIWATGKYKGTVDFDPGPSMCVYSLGQGAYLSKFSSDGTHLWTGVWGGPTDYDEGRGIAISKSNGWVYVTGSFGGTANFAADPKEQLVDLRTSNGSSDCFLSIFYPSAADPYATYANAYTWGGPQEDHAYGITMGYNDSTVLVTGEFRATNVDFHPENGGDFHDSVGGCDAFLSSFGGGPPTKTWGGPGDDRGLAVTCGFNGTPYVTGSFTGTVDFDPGPGVENHTSNGGSDAFLTCGFYGMPTRTWGGPGNDYGLSVCADTAYPNNIFVSGSFQASVNFNPVGGSQRTSQGASDAFLSAFDAFGYFQGVDVWGGPGQDAANDVDVPRTDYAYVAGYFNSTVDFDPGSMVDIHTSNGYEDVFLSKLPVTGMPINQPPVAIAKASPNPQTVGQAVTFSDNGSYDPDGTIAKYEWDWNNDGVYEDTGQIAYYSWPTAGTYQVQFRVTDDGGATGTLAVPLSIVINGSNQSPVAFAKADPNPQIAGQPVTFSDNGSYDPDGTIAKYEWSWNNGDTYEPLGASTQHTWDIPGTYYVQFKVTDKEGAWATLNSPLVIYIEDNCGISGAHANEICNKWQSLNSDIKTCLGDIVGGTYNNTSTPWDQCTPTGINFDWAKFQSGSINYVINDSKAYYICGAFYDEWGKVPGAAGQSYASSYIGVMKSDPIIGSYLEKSSGLYYDAEWQQFECGILARKVKTDSAFNIRGYVYQFWSQSGAMDGYGCPTSDETPTGDGTIQDFVNGSICYHNGGIASDCSGIPGDNAQFPVDNYMYHISQAWNVPNSEWKGIHMGEDIGFKAGTPVFAMADGTVVHSQNHPPKPPKKNYGYLVIIEHDIPGYGKICSLYGHLASNIIGKGPVSKGQLIGFIGTYDENGHNPEHLHFGLYPGPYNSKDWIYEGYDPPGHIGDTIRPSDFVNQY